MEGNERLPFGPEGSEVWSRDESVAGGFSVVMAERVLGQACGLGLAEQWKELWLGRPTGRRTSFRPEHRVAAVLAGLACGLRGVAPGNFVLRPNSAMRHATGGRFPDQGTIHRWLEGVTTDQAAALRSHLHRVVREHGEYRQELWSNRMIPVDVDGQGLIARGQRFERAAGGYMDDGLDRGFQRYVAYVGATREVLDELLTPGNQTLMSALPEVVRGLNEVFTKEERERVLLRMDSHGGTRANLLFVRKNHYHYLCPLYSYWAVQRVKRHVAGRRGGWFDYPDSNGQVLRIQYWVLRRWELSGRGRQPKLRTRGTAYFNHSSTSGRRWVVLLSDLKRETGARAWAHYHERSGTIEEFNDQSERAYHLEVMRTGSLEGLNAVHSLIGLCWNLTRWATRELRLPPQISPAAPLSAWVPAAEMDMSQVLSRASHSGLRLHRAGQGAVLEVEDTVGNAESKGWQRWLCQPIQQRLRLAG